MIRCTKYRRFFARSLEAALRWFIASRGRPSTIYSDDGNNLVGTADFLQKIDLEKIEKFASEKRISWKFSPPAAPWWGGFEEELVTVVCDAKSLINSRPLTYLSEDPDDLLGFTRSMFLQKIREVVVPDLDMIDSKRLN
ncbi:integrase catalytic domain-containing protein [Trichonephila clavipes]|nr:integrase catalytic domain-containing protein [Trichonephila clavipes]